MIPFPGESVILGNAVNVTAGYDATLYTDVVIRENDRALTVGDEWRFWVYPGETDYLEEPGADVAVSWVVEVASGSGTITAAWGFDPTYSDTSAATPNALGSHAVTGPTTLILPTTLTADDVLNHDDAFHLRLDGTAGTPIVQQVKLRVWPTAGVAGGWSEPNPSFVTDWTVSAPRFAEFHFEAEATAPTAEPSWVDAWDGISTAAADVTPNTFYPGQPILLSKADQYRSLSDLDDTTDIDIVAVAAIIRGRDWRNEFPISDEFVEGVDWVRPPGEVAGDFSVYADQLDGAGTDWDRAFASVVVVGRPVPLEGGPTYAAVARDDLTFTAVGGGGVVADVALNLGGALIADTPGTGGDVASHIALPTGGTAIVVHFGHTSVAPGGSPPVWPGTAPSPLSPISHSSRLDYAFGVGVPPVAGVPSDFLPIRSRAVLPTYRYWSPTAVAVEPLRLMQRGDGLGMGSGRILSTGTRQASTRLYGSL